MIEDDLTYLLKEDVLDAQRTRRPSERVSDSFRKIYSISPLEYLIMKEEKEELRKRGMELQEFCKQNFTLEEYSFLLKALGNKFGETLRMPREFRDLTEEEFSEYLASNQEKFRGRLNALMENMESGRLRVIPVKYMEDPYFFSNPDRIIAIYESVRTGNNGFPEKFFTPTNRRLAKVLTRYLFDVVLKIPHRKIIPEARRGLFEENKLDIMLDIVYEGSVAEAITDAYPEKTYQDVHKPDYRPDDIVDDVLKTLDVI